MNSVIYRFINLVIKLPIQVECLISFVKKKTGLGSVNTTDIPEKYMSDMTSPHKVNYHDNHRRQSLGVAITQKLSTRSTRKAHEVLWMCQTMTFTVILQTIRHPAVHIFIASTI